MTESGNLSPGYSRNVIFKSLWKLLKCTDFLDVNMDLTSGKYWPFRKQNSELLYINTKSNHPPNIIKHIPAAITHRIASLSCNNEEYVKALPAYKEALESSGHQLLDQPAPPTTRNRRQRRRKAGERVPYSIQGGKCFNK